ncbi:MAG TPA: hypothetical protein DEA87_02500 [Candidatus Veblenbacteria bacterium]|nr:hypothetical protein [Candidatus Veblenbacteria bacterium]
MADKQNRLDIITPKITWWIGSPSSIVLHTLFFLIMLSLAIFGVNTTNMLLVLTTIVSLEAIYLSIFIQYTVNQQARVITEVAADIGEVTEDVDEISKDVDEISKDVDELSKDVDEISEDVDDLQADAEKENVSDTETYARMERQIGVILAEITTLKNKELIKQSADQVGK